MGFGISRVGTLDHWDGGGRTTRANDVTPTSPGADIDYVHHDPQSQSRQFAFPQTYPQSLTTRLSKALLLRCMTPGLAQRGHIETVRYLSAFGGEFNESTQHLLILADEEVCEWRGMHGHGSRRNRRLSC